MRANKMLYDQTDRVKSFNSSLLLSDVLQERDLQIDLKRRVEETRERHEAVLVKEREKPGRSPTTRRRLRLTNGSAPRCARGTRSSSRLSSSRRRS